ncbi:MAG: class I SAM-dependent methyltransferase [Candidatus Marinimicrobia bacterium]|jgi:SAM-dependent methyltransferase|nr:class I SAM-dependent methyltransferase [Candidatus Neomarinimicrobiota bacterium]|tara:strand:+ start:828 stop:1430 length:603 start_codon:yes stop_codon:yes gene_type:complete
MTEKYIVDETQNEWDETYGSDSFRHKNKYPNPEIINFVMKSFGNNHAKNKIKILDIGCGWGNNLKFLQDQGFNYYGIDFSKKAVSHCKETFKNVILGDFSLLPYPDGYFDCVIDRQAIQHNSKSKIITIVNQVYQKLKPGGIFYSMLAASGHYEFFTSKLSKFEVLELLSIFNKVLIDYLEKSYNNEKSISKWHLVTATK